MQKPPRVWIAASEAPRVLVPAAASALSRGRSSLVPLHRSTSVQGAELAGPWLLRTAVRLPRGARLAAPGEQACRWLGAVHVRWLNYLGIGAAALHEGRDVVHWASFVARGPGDVVVGPRKITSVTLTRRPNDVLLVAGTLLESAPWPLLCRALGRSEHDAAFLEASAVPATMLAKDVQPQAWAAYLRSMLHLSLALTELQDGAPVE